MRLKIYHKEFSLFLYFKIFVEATRGNFKKEEEEKKQLDVAMNGVENACACVPGSFNHNIGSAFPHVCRCMNMCDF